MKEGCSHAHLSVCGSGRFTHTRHEGAYRPGHAAVTVLLDGKPIVDARGTDVGADGVARFDRSGMIRLVAGVPQRRRVLTLASSDPGLRAYVFTFGP